MKAIAFANRLARDIDEKSIVDLTADVRLEILDAINGGLQKLHALAPASSKETTAGLYVPAPETFSITVTSGSVDFTGRSFASDELYRTIRIGEDGIDNQVVGTNRLLHPYSGNSGTFNATVFADAILIPEPYSEMVGDPRILETGWSIPNKERNWLGRPRDVRRPECYTIENNARNRNSIAPALIRFDSLPDQIYRLEARFILAPERVTFADLLAPGVEIPLRSELVEVYLLPIARGILSFSSLWRDKDARKDVRDEADLAEKKYSALVPQYVGTPNNRLGTPPGF